ncbi:amino acid ABC transporter permease [Bacillus sp. 165]|uniref:amino acid ABC transporter permease n=1 Tax=Bacillus sp. 165 TaxID=1529117 RepID=UPI001ADD4F4C|nr:amino acid ABC transporter permease [Bacillus sp. 165]MBO9128145.1 amino acid ABC transporter permease [Bacillus sp. 165]
MDWQFSIITEYAPFFLKGLLLTLLISIIGVLCGTVLGLAVGLGRMSSKLWIRLPFVWYINFFRGTPLLVQLLIIHFGVMPLFMSPPSGIASAAVGLSLNAAAYIAEIFRAGIQSIDKGQTEAGRSLGMTHVQTMRYIIIPQAFKRMIPPLGNEFIVLLKDSSLASLLAAPELLYWGKAAVAQYYRVWEPYLTVALIYLVLTLSLTHLLNYLEKRLDTNDKSKTVKKTLRDAGGVKGNFN